jgi:hypothetical protein
MVADISEIESERIIQRFNEIVDSLRIIDNNRLFAKTSLTSH